MEKTVKVKKPRRFGDPLSDFMLKILAVILAVIVWFAMSVTLFPTISKTITKVPVEFSISGTTAESKDLQALGYEDFTVDVKITGMNYEIGTYTANDLVASVDLNPVTKEGTYTLDIDVKSAHSSDKCTIESITPKEVEVKFDHIDSIKLPLTVSAPNVSAEEGFMLKETVLTPNEIEIQGAENDLDRLSKAVAFFSDSLTISEDSTLSTTDIRLYDADDNLLDKDNYTLSTKSVDINFVVYKKVTAQLAAEFTDMPPGFNISSLSYSLSQDTLQIITPQLDANSSEEIKLSAISMYDVTPGKTFNTEIDSILSTGEINQSGTEQVEVSFDLTGYESKTFKISAKKIEIINAPDGKSVSLDNEQLANVTIFGPSDVISKIKSSDLRAYIDLSDVSANGSISHEVMIYSPKYSSVWNIGTHEAVVTVADSTTDTSSSAASTQTDSASE